MDNTTSETTVYYNGACPVCRGFAGRHKGQPGVRWCDIRDEGNEAARFAIKTDEVERRLHLVEADGTILRGYPAMLRLRELSVHKTTNSRVLRALQTANVEFWSWLLYRLNRMRK